MRLLLAGAVLLTLVLLTSAELSPRDRFLRGKRHREAMQHQQQQRTQRNQMPQHRDDKTGQRPQDLPLLGEFLAHRRQQRHEAEEAKKNGARTKPQPADEEKQKTQRRKSKLSQRAAMHDKKAKLMPQRRRPAGQGQK